MARQVVQLLPATPADRRRALEEVKDFAFTDMGYGDEGRWTYRLLPEPALSDELRRLAHPRSTANTDSVTFQPCRSYEQRSQDRHVVERWTIHGSSWVFTAVFDGHVNHNTVDLATEKVPPLVRTSLEALLAQTTSPSPARISDLLSQAIAEVDSAIMSDFLSIFARANVDVSNVRPEFAKPLINDLARGGQHHEKVSRVLGGSTALLTLYNERHGDLWVANLGDCCAVLGTWDRSRWSATLINSIHNGSNVDELNRVKSEHPLHEQCIQEDRILGWLAPTRAIGDFWLKLPRIYTENIFIHFDGMKRDPLHKYVSRIQTPPYVSTKADVYHRRIRGRHGGAAGPRDVFLITCTDGMLDLAHGEPLQLSQQLLDRWVGVVGATLQQRHAHPPNLALALLRDSIGGQDTELVSRNLTVEMDERWMDDTTILVQRFA
ncbi:protein serine/threonine phosphatase 2C [Phanerochaete sordida]|uniref:Protein serine/threonine phosphatase 2C n=1 Tax=Phanerochaete sordida TaxID=48140 RepID=A0A9P3GJX5_9APHY|nr:protein serine/threonine phosphatase 2C [Phanerochaete sordida]